MAERLRRCAFIEPARRIAARARSRRRWGKEDRMTQPDGAREVERFLLATLESAPNYGGGVFELWKPQPLPAIFHAVAMHTEQTCAQEGTDDRVHASLEGNEEGCGPADWVAVLVERYRARL